MGFPAQLTWTSWGFNQVLVPAIGGGRLAGAWGMWDAQAGHPTSTRARLAWQEFYDVLMIRTAGYQPSTGANWAGEPEGFASWKEVRGPVIATAVDATVAAVAGTATRKVKTGPIQWIGSK